MALDPAAALVELLKVPTAVQLMDEYVLVSQRSGPQDLEQSTEYRWNDFVPAFEQMASAGIAGNTFQAPSVKAGLVNIALFLAQCMHETIQYNACDENNWSLALGVPDYPLTAACGQAGQDYSQYKCSAAESHMECPIDNNMALQATTYAAWGGAPPPLFCAPTSMTGDALPRWTYVGECGPAGYQTIPAFPEPYISQTVKGNGKCNAYQGQFAGSFTFNGCDASRGCPNTDNVDTAGGTIHYDVEGCCWWGRGVIQTTGPCNMGKLNYYLAGREYQNGVAQQWNPNAPFANLNFCTDPNVICDGPKELRWISGMFYWLFDVQGYSNPNYNWEFSSLLNRDADAIFQDPSSSTAKSLVDATSGLVNRGCPASSCPGSGNVHALAERFHNFETALKALKHIYDPNLYPAPSGAPAPPNEGAWYSKAVMCQSCSTGQCAIRWSKNGAVSCAGWVSSQSQCETASSVAAAWCDGSSVPPPTPVAPTPVAPTPVAPTPVAPTPVAPTPVAPTPVAPTPVAPSPVAPTPVAPTPVAPTPVAPTPVAPTPVAPTPVAPTPVAPSPVTPPPPPTGNFGDDCTNCIGYTSGPCQQANRVCWSFLPNSATCPPNTVPCFSEVPSEGQPPAPAPSGGQDPPTTSEMCTDCFVGTSGPCIQADKVCRDYQDSASKTCPPYSTPCAVTNVPTDACTDCFPGTSGQCKQTNNNVCWDYLDAAAKTCPQNTLPCVVSEPSSTPVASPPTEIPVIEPTVTPVREPTVTPVREPTVTPVREPTVRPMVAPTANPSSSTTMDPTGAPAAAPTASPVSSPTRGPTVASAPTANPVGDPPASDMTREPAASPTRSPEQQDPMTASPTSQPNTIPTTSNPVVTPTTFPSAAPTVEPQPSPTMQPQSSMGNTLTPTSTPVTQSPTPSPIARPTRAPVPALAPSEIIMCENCFQGTSGPCQQSDGVCRDYIEAQTRTCPAGTTECEAVKTPEPSLAPQAAPVLSASTKTRVAKVTMLVGLLMVQLL